MSLILVSAAAAQEADLFLQDTLTDSGVEPYAGSDPVYLSPDIWVRRTPDPNHDPYPFPTGSPSWTPAPHENPEYRDPKTSQPNYVYIRIHNRGDGPSTGSERLRLYQAKASTGLAWPGSWVDNLDNACGQDLLHGIEITKPRLNAKAVSATTRQAYRDAVIAIQTNPAFRFSDGMPYFQKQNLIHAGAGNPEHGNPAFLPWHREMISRFEELLREHDPLLTLLYWDFTADPRAGVNLFTSDFMGQSSGAVTGPLGTALPIPITRNVGGSVPGRCGQALFPSDGTLTGQANFPNLGLAVERIPNHDCAHGYIGGYQAPVGPISVLSTAAQDPFFFQLHANVDRQWANWQRSGADPSRLDPVAVYGAASSNSRINTDMSPWDGDTGLAPWTGPAAYSKDSKNPSVVFPPIYDTAPLNIPVLQPGQSLVVEIPWYPPDVNNFNCAGDAGHFCLLARIETQSSAPFGMTSSEGMSVSANTRNNNNIAWKNVEIVDDVSDSSAMKMMTGTMLHNVFDREAIFRFRLVDRTEKRRFLLPELADVALILPEDALARLAEDREGLNDLTPDSIKGVEGKALRLTGKEPGFRLQMKPGERITMQLVVQPRGDKPNQELLAEPFLYDIEQTIDLPQKFFPIRNGEDMLAVGGVRFELDLARALQSLDKDQIQLADLRTTFVVDRLRGVKNVEPALLESPHLSPGEPLDIIAESDDPERPMQRMTLSIDGQERASSAGERLSERLSFETPGVHTIVTRGIDPTGALTERRIRVLVSENIPPITSILSPVGEVMVKLGESVSIQVETTPAWQREVKEVTLRAKDDLLFQGGLNLIESDYPEVARSEGPGPHELTFTPEAPGTYMLQVGARDDAGNLGLSGHVHVMVME